MARPGRYDKEIKPHLNKIADAVAAGATVEEIAKGFRVAVSTMHRWMTEHKELKDAFARGRGEVIIEIKAALLKKALGFHFDETKKLARKDKSGTSVVSVETFTRYCPPSETAATMLLRNYDKTWHDTDHASATLREQEQELRTAIAKSNNFDLEINDKTEE